MFWNKREKKKETEEIVYDPSEKTPVIRCSICTGEQVGGLKEIGTGHFEEIMLIRQSADLKTFMKLVGREDIPKEY